MIKPELDPDLGIEQNFHRPFGPQFLDFYIKGPIREKLLEIVNRHRFSEHPVEGLSSFAFYWRKGITKGRVEYISKQIDDEEFGGFVDNTISKLIRQYVINCVTLKNGEDHDDVFIFIPSSIWWNEMKSGDFWVIHNHAVHPSKSLTFEGEVSGNIYLKVPDKLHEPQGNITFFGTGSGVDAYHSILPQAGKVYIWPSHVQHCVYPMTLEESDERVVISFNGHWKKK